MRTSEGELYELLVTRGLVNPMPEGRVYPDGKWLPE